MRLVTVEEHYSSPTINQRAAELLAADGKAVGPNDARGNGGEMLRRVQELGPERIAYMDEHGIDTQVVSLAGTVPALLDPVYAVPLCRDANDEMAQKAAAYPGRFRLFANLPLGDPDAAATELERCVAQKHFVGTMISGHWNGLPYDDPWYLPIFQKAVELDVPVYLHPGLVPPQVQDAYYKGPWGQRAQFELAGYGIGWHYDVGMQVVRMALAGVFDRLPGLKVVLGHWGEVVAYYLERLDEVSYEAAGVEHPLSHYFRHNVWVNPSGMTYDPQFRFCLEEFGADHILWGEDYPYRLCDNIRTQLEGFDLPDGDREKIAHGNAEALFRI